MPLGHHAKQVLCMACGSTRVRHQTTAEGLWAAGGEGVTWVCDACHHIGTPFLVDREGPDPGREDLWDEEYREAAFALDNETWGTESRPGNERNGWGVTGLFLLLGILFLTAVASAVQQAVASGFLINILRALVGTGWLLAIGIVLLVVGVRRSRLRPTDTHRSAPEPSRGDERPPTGP